MLNYSYKFLNNRVIIDMILIVIVNIAAYLFFAKIDALEWLYEYSTHHEEYELDEVITLFFTISISLAIFSLRRWQEIIKLVQELEKLAVKDPLTNIFNRRYLNDMLVSEIIRTSRTEDAFSLIMIDIDHFKKINDNYGHNIGDRVICQISELLVNLSREVDIVSRWGGEEFIILCPKTPTNNAEKLGKRILQSIRNFQFDSVGQVTASIGIAPFTKNDTPESMLHKVDSCLYEAKNSGRDRLVLFNIENYSSLD
jgi:diguanylate cyclase (GGDEF)-like protein